MTVQKDPTPEEILSRCLAAQRHWSERERLKRAGMLLEEERNWTPPIIPAVELSSSDQLIE